MRKLNYDDVKKCVESYGFELISTEYHGVHDKIKIKCSKGHESEMIFSNFKRRHGCPKCSNRAKLKYEDVKSSDNTQQWLKSEFVLQMPKDEEVK